MPITSILFCSGTIKTFDATRLHSQGGCVSFLLASNAPSGLLLGLDGTLAPDGGPFFPNIDGHQNKLGAFSLLKFDRGWEVPPGAAPMMPPSLVGKEKLLVLAGRGDLVSSPLTGLWAGTERRRP